MNVTAFVCGLSAWTIRKSNSNFFSVPLGLIPERSFRYRITPSENPTRIPSDFSSNFNRKELLFSLKFHSMLLTTLGNHFKLVTLLLNTLCDRIS